VDLATSAQNTPTQRYAVISIEGVTLARLLRVRFSARIPSRAKGWSGDSISAGRVAVRHASLDSRQSGGDTSRVAETETNYAPDHVKPVLLPALKKTKYRAPSVAMHWTSARWEQPTKWERPAKWEEQQLSRLGIRANEPASRFYIPAVIGTSLGAATTGDDILHILGHDAMSKFLAHALQGTYQSVNLVGQHPHKNRYNDIAFERTREKVPNAGLEESGEESVSDKGFISNLIVTGSAVSAVAAMETVRDRINQDTVVCLMPDGLGVAEQVDKNLFGDAGMNPQYVLGHTDRPIHYDRNAQAVTALKGGRLTLTAITPSLKDSTTPALDLSFRRHTSASFMRRVTSADYLSGQTFSFDSWLKAKLPNLIFSSVVDPVSVFLACRYDEILQNTWAMRLIDQLLDEITEVVDSFPEVQRLDDVRRLLRGEGIRKQCFGKLKAKGKAPSRMALQVERGQKTDIDFLNGYFIRRGTRLGISLPANEMVVGMVKAKHFAQVRKREAYIPWDETTLPKQL
jgi:cytochrome b translational activator protein CBS2, mitochondrial